MARPLNKKYFGNRNVGTNGTSDDGIGGEGVGSVTIGTEGTYTSALPTATFSTPDIPGGVRATGTVHGHALTAVATAAGSGYHLADVLTLPSGSGIVTPATFTVTGLKVVSITLNNGGTANDVGDIFQFAVSGFATPLRVRVTASSGGTATAVEIADAGVWTSGALPTNTIGMTRTQTYGAQDMNGQNLQVNITGWGVATVAVAQQGDYTTISSGAKATTVAPTGGSGATLTVTYGVSGVVVDQKGSGYTSASDAAVTFSGGTAAGTSVLTTDSGSYGNSGNDGSNMNSGNQENAIRMTAYLPGGSATEVDIIKQVGSRRYKVTDGTRTGVVTLQDSLANAAGEGSISAVDSAGGTYFLQKITARRALVTRGTGTQFATGQSVPWNMTAAVANVSVKISNA